MTTTYKTFPSATAKIADLPIFWRRSTGELTTVPAKWHRRVKPHAEDVPGLEYHLFSTREALDGFIAGLRLLVDCDDDISYDCRDLPNGLFAGLVHSKDWETGQITRYDHRARVSTPQTDKKAPTSFLVVQQGGSSTELYAHIFDSLSDALAYRKSAADHTYQTTEPLALPRQLAGTSGLTELLDDALRSSASLR